VFYFGANHCRSLLPFNYTGTCSKWATGRSHTLSVLFVVCVIKYCVFVLHVLKQIITLCVRLCSYWGIYTGVLPSMISPSTSSYHCRAAESFIQPSFQDIVPASNLAEPQPTSPSTIWKRDSCVLRRPGKQDLCCNGGK